MFEVSSSLCSPSTDIRVFVVATNVFGDGPPSEATLISKQNVKDKLPSSILVEHTDAINHFVKIEFDFTATNAVKCTFLNQKGNAMKSCGIDYGSRNMIQCYSNNLSLSSEGNPTTSDTVHVHLHPSIYYGVVYCYRLTASYGINTVVVTGTFTGVFNVQNKIS